MRPILWLGTVLLAFSALPLWSQEDDGAALIDRKIVEVLRSELSGELAKDHVIAITRHHRIQGSRGYSDAARYVLNQLREFGFGPQEAWIESFPSDGALRYQTWQSPSGWSIDTAELRMVEPRRELIVRYPEIAMSVITYSNPGRVRAELVDVGAGTSDSDYQGKDVEGKLVLATGYGGEVHRLAVLKYGAAAVICYLNDDRAAHHPDMTGYTGMWPRTDEIPRVTFGFNLSNRQGRRLKELLTRGQRVVLDARVDGVGLEPGRMDVVVAVVKGASRPEKELVYTAHLDHPKESANDNASGSAALLDMARSLKSLVSDNRLPQPGLTLRFLWVPELFGTMAYLDAHSEFKGPELGGNYLAGLNLDMVGENLELLHSRLNITRPPPTISSVLPDITEAMAHFVDSLEISSPRGSQSNFNFRVTPYTGGSDHVILNDGAVRIPAMMLGHWPDYTHHTSEDTPDKVDPVQLERIELIASATFWHLANQAEAQSLKLTNLVAEKAQGRLASATNRAVALLLESPAEEIATSYHEAKEIVDFSLRREQRSVANVLDFASFDRTRRLVDTWQQALEGQGELMLRTLHALFYQRSNRSPMPRLRSEGELAAARRIPRRLTRGPLPRRVPELLLAEDRRPWYESEEARALDRYLLVNLIDGDRSVLEIRDALSAATRPVPLTSVERFVQDLETAGIVEFADR